MSGQALAAASPAAPQGTAARDAAPDLLVALRQLLGRLGLVLSDEALIAGMPVAGGDVSEEQITRIAHQHGFEARWGQRRLADLSALLLPALLRRQGGRAAVLLALHEAEVEALLPELGDEPVRLPRAAFETELDGRVLLLKPLAGHGATDARSGVDELLAPGHWFWRVIRHFRAYYVEAAVAALMVNVLALASTFFTMNVYDRVIATQATTTLWTLAIGVCVALVFEFLLRNLRAWLLDNAGKKADLLLGSQLFARTLATRLEARPPSAGAFANMLKEYESLRDFATSTVLVMLSDLPFVLLFLAVLYMIAGPLALVPALAVPLLLIVGAIAQVPLARSIRQNLREASVRHGVLIEAIDSAETIKALRAEGRMQALYERASAVTALTANRMRLVTNAVLNFHSAVSTFTTVAMVTWGVYLIGDGQLTQGGLIGAVILTGRLLAPLGALNGLAVRIQQARSSLQTLDGIMARPVDREPGRAYAQRAVRQGHLSVRDLKFAYAPQAPKVIRDASFDVRRGERMAILGRVGSGKTTLLKLLAGLYQPTEGLVLVDGVDLRQVDPAEFRRSVLYVGQQAQLFWGTLRENLKLGAPWASDEEMMRAAAATGVHGFAQQHPMGYDMIVGERGENLSGGQRQAIALARALLVDPDVFLLDEPTSAMDNGTEAIAMRALFDLAEQRHKTVVLVTHKLQLLDYVQRVLVIDQGVRTADGPRDAVMQAMREGKVRKIDPGAALARPAQRPPGSAGAAAPGGPGQPPQGGAAQEGQP